MAHFATTALIRKRGVEKRSKKHIEKTSKMHEKSDENSLRFLHPFSTKFFMDFNLILGHFPEKNVEKPLPEGFLEFHVFRH